MSNLTKKQSHHYDNSGLIDTKKTVPDWSLNNMSWNFVPQTKHPCIRTGHPLDFIYPQGSSVHSRFFQGFPWPLHWTWTLAQIVMAPFDTRGYDERLRKRRQNKRSFVEKMATDWRHVCVGPAWWWSCSSSPPWWLSLSPFSLAPVAPGHAPLLPAAPCAAVMPPIKTYEGYKQFPRRKVIVLLENTVTVLWNEHKRRNIESKIQNSF